jgi:hypothetical protein
VKKFKKALALSLTLAMGMSMVACGDKKEGTTSAGTQADTQAPATTEAPKTEETKTEAPKTEEPKTEEPKTDAPATSGPEFTTGNGEKVHVYAWNTELGGHLENFIEAEHPELKDLIVYHNLQVGGTSADYLQKIKDAINSNEAPSIVAADNDAFKNLMEQDWVVPLTSIGFDTNWYANAYDFTVQLGTNKDGELVGTTWQCTPGVMVYRASIAQDVFGSSAPADVQAKVKDVATMEASFAEIKDKGYFPLACAGDLERPYLDQRTNAWVVDGALQMDDSITEYLTKAKEYQDKGWFKGVSMWQDDWNASMSQDVFAYFGCPWFVSFTLAGNVKGTAAAEDYKVTEGPTMNYAWHWGGTYLMATNKVANPELTNYIIWYYTCNEDFLMKAISDDRIFNFPNNKKVADDAIKAGTGAMPLLGGQNPVEIYAKTAPNVSLKLATKYDTQLNGIMESARDNYLNGTLGSVDEVIAEIKTQAADQIPDITVQ